MRTKNETSNIILWSFIAGLVVGLVGCGGTDDNDGSMMTDAAPVTYVSCRVDGGNVNSGKPCLPSSCVTRVDQSTGIAWQYANAESYCNDNGACIGTSVTMCGSATDNPCVGGGDAGEVAHCSM